MTAEEVLFEKIKVLPPNLKQKAIEFVDSLQTEAAAKPKRKSLKGALAHLNIKISDEDFRRAGNEMWRGYTKETEEVRL